MAAPDYAPAESLSRASRLALLSAALGLVLGAAALGLGLSEGAIALAAFGAASLLQVPVALTVRSRVRDGLGNRGLDRERRTLRAIGHLLRFLALGVALARTLLELAAVLLAGNVLGHWFPWADALTGLALALRLFFEGRTLAKGATLPAACGGCGSGCGCG